MSNGKQTHFNVVEGANPEDEFDSEAIERASQGEFLPLLRLSEMTENGTVEVEFRSEPRLVESEALPNGKAWFVDVNYAGLPFSMVLPRSLLFSLVALKRREGWDRYEGHKVVITATKGTISTPRFTGEAKTYRASLPIEE